MRYSSLIVFISSVVYPMSFICHNNYFAYIFLPFYYENTQTYKKLKALYNEHPDTYHRYSTIVETFLYFPY